MTASGKTGDALKAVRTKFDEDEQKRKDAINAKLYAGDYEAQLLLIDLQKQQQAITDKIALQKEDTRIKTAEKRKADAAKLNQDLAEEALTAAALARKGEQDLVNSLGQIRFNAAETESARVQIESENKRTKLTQDFENQKEDLGVNLEALALAQATYDNNLINLDLETEEKFAELDAEALARQEKTAEDTKKIDEKALADKKAYQQQLQDLVLDSALSLITDLKALNANYDKDNEEAAKKAFEREKALSIVSTLITTYVAAQKAFASQIIIGDPTSIVRGQIAAAVAVVSGLARVAIIAGQNFEPSGSSSSSSTSSAPAKSTPSTYAEGGLLTGNSHDLGGIRTSMGELEGGEFIMNRRATANFLPLLESINSLGNTNAAQVQVAAQQPIVKTYVVATDMTSQQEANARLNALARL